ncbi:hypothetical protein Ocin01_08342 [Orchesella cincta]|uniref:Uncharacterized protein n=1 Tax=Orchesella cincta TaxID=48709 RepID=A0A1D2MZC3_ORCCI|nr:hypothetical protein Ocin01_08342 [Orchesella cincta]
MVMLNHLPLPKGTLPGWLTVNHRLAQDAEIGKSPEHCQLSRRPVFMIPVNGWLAEMKNLPTGQQKKIKDNKLHFRLKI